MNLLFLSLFLSLRASADSTIQSEEYTRQILPGIVANATDVVTECEGGVCKISWVPNKNAVISFPDDKSQKIQLKTELASIAAKLDDNTATAADRNRAIKIIIILLGL